MTSPEPLRVALSEDERDRLADVVSGKPLARDIDMGALYVAVEQIIADRDSALRERMLLLADEFDAKGRRGSAHFGADVGDTIRLWVERNPLDPAPHQQADAGLGTGGDSGNGARG